MEKIYSSLQVEVNGKPIREYAFKGETWVEGRIGSKYVLKVRNKSARRVMAVLTVDGKSVMNGKPGNYMSTGYILDPGRSVDIPGWRLDNEEVAGFEFAPIEQSYAAKRGNPENVGVIGCAIIEEFVPVELPETLISKGYGDNMRGPAQTFGKGIGTAFGAPIKHKVKTVEFHRGITQEILMIRYGDRETLEAIGLNLRHTPLVGIDAHPESANPFPETGCPIPDDWEYRNRIKRNSGVEVR